MNEENDRKMEYKARCRVCGGQYTIQATREGLAAFLSLPFFICEAGRHVEFGSVGEYLEVLGESKKLSPRPRSEGLYSRQGEDAYQN